MIDEEICVQSSVIHNRDWGVIFSLPVLLYVDRTIQYTNKWVKIFCSDEET